MSADAQHIRATFDKLIELSKDRLLPDESNASKEVFSNLVLANSTAFRRLLTEIATAQKALPASKRPDEHKALEKIYQVGAKVRKNASWSLNQNKGALQKALQEILDVMTKMEQQLLRAVRQFDRKHTEPVSNWNETIQTMFATDLVIAPLPASSGHPELPKPPAIWDEEEERLLPMTCASIQEWGLRYALNDNNRVAFFPGNASVEQIDAWCVDRANEVKENGLSFKKLAVYDTVGKKVF